MADQMTFCAALVYRPDPWTGRGKAVPDRCGRLAVARSIWCGQHRRMVRAGKTVKKFDGVDGYVSGMPAAIFDTDGTKNFAAPGWVPDWLVNDGVRVPGEVIPTPTIDDAADPAQQED
jgi:hypothetical protein